MLKWGEIPGWFDYIETYRWVVDSYDGGVLVELGCYLGRSLVALAELVRKSGKPFRVVGVDHCRGSGVENGADNHGIEVEAGGGSFVGRLWGNVIASGYADIVSLVIAESSQAASLFADESVTMVFIDASHDYESVKRDIGVWLPKVKCGGCIGGDDFGVPDEPVVIWPGVSQAVREMLPGWRHSPHDAWLWEKP